MLMRQFGTKDWFLPSDSGVRDRDIEKKQWMSYKDFQALPQRIAKGIEDFEISIGGFLYLAFLPDTIIKFSVFPSDYISIIISENGQSNTDRRNYVEVS